MNSVKPRLLLHTCCAVCAGGVLDRLKDYAVTLYFYNPNIDTGEEYFKRAGELEKLKALYDTEDVIIPEYSSFEFCQIAGGLEDCPEGGARCGACAALRLNGTARRAKADGFGIFATTLSVSPHKNSSVINFCGEKAEEEFGIKYLRADFKKDGGFLKANSVAKDLGIYRQRYCGCRFQKR
jgi:predicted adenine nucleotide alpha hydrolase (AANH) superfamily ATPase